MTVLRLDVPDMTCGGCAKSITKVLQSIDPDAHVETDPSTHEVRVESTADESALLAALDAAGFPAEQHGEAALG